MIPRYRDWVAVRLGVDRGAIDRGFLIHCGTLGFMAGPAIIGVPVREFFAQADRWLAWRGGAEARELVRLIKVHTFGPPRD